MQSGTQPTRNPTQRATPLKRARFWLVYLLFLCWTMTIAARLFWLQVVRHHDYVARAERQQGRSFQVAPRRGVLFDRNQRELAMTVQVDSIFAVPGEIADKPAAAHLLAPIVHTDPEDAQTSEEQIAARLQSGHGFAWIARRVAPDVAARVHALTDPGTAKGIYFQKEFQRFYPDNEIAAQMLGYVGMDDNGLGGLEQKFEAQLHGAPGQMHTALDARRHVIGSSESDPQPGRSLTLTIDRNIQFMAERALDHAMERTHSDNGTVVVQDVHTGQILALAIRPTFNPNLFRRSTPELLRNHAVSDAYEPGSVFKLVTYSAALEEGVAKPDDKIDCQGGQIKMPGGRIIHDEKGEHFGVITVHEALEHSSDVAAVKLAMKVGQERFNQYIHNYGFGARSGVELPGETRGLLRPLNRWNVASIGYIAIGQEVGVTPVQLVSMVSTIANGGVYLPPRVLMPGQIDSSANEKTLAPPQVAQAFKAGGDLPNPLPDGAHRVISTMTAAQMRKMMEGVVLFGTGTKAQLNGYSSGGKTGTAQKIDPATHQYSKTMHIASFVGIAPVNTPVIAVAVVMDNPKDGAYHGADVSAPVFTEVAQQVLEYLSVPHDIEVRRTRSTAIQKVTEDDAHEQTADIHALYDAANDLPGDDPLRDPNQLAPAPTNANHEPSSAQTANAATNTTLNKTPVIAAQPAGAPTQTAPAKATRTVIVSDGKTLPVPSLIGLPMRKVIEQAAAAGLDVQITGSGKVREQVPAPGTMVPPGTKIVVRCGR